MNKRTQLQKFTRKSKNSLRKLKYLNSDYYLKPLNPNKKGDANSPKNQNIQRSNKKLFSSESSTDKCLRETRCSSKQKKKKEYQLGGYERTRSSTILNQRKSVISPILGMQKKQYKAIYERVQKVLEAYQTKIEFLQQKNKSLSRQNSRLRALSSSSYQ